MLADPESLARGLGVPSRGMLARYHAWPRARPGQRAGVSHSTVAQVRTDLRGIIHAERNWSANGWRLAVAARVPGRLGTWQVSHPPAPRARSGQRVRRQGCAERCPGAAGPCCSAPGTQPGCCTDAPHRELARDPRAPGEECRRAARRSRRWPGADRPRAVPAAGVDR
jgi:hypothetical protein